MKRKTEEEKIVEYVNFFEKFCKALGKRNDGYVFSFGVEKVEKAYIKTVGYRSFLNVFKKGETEVIIRMYPMYEDSFTEKPKKTKLNSLRCLFRKVFSDRSLFIYHYNVSEDKGISEDLVDKVLERHNITARFEKYKTPIEAEMKLTLLGFEFDQFNEGVFREQEGISRLYHR